MIFIATLLLGHERQNGDDAGAFHGDRQRALMARAVAADAARQNLAAFGNVLAQARLIFVIDRLEAVGTERTDLALGAALFLAALLDLLFGGGMGSLSCRWMTAGSESGPTHVARQSAPR